MAGHLSIFAIAGQAGRSQGFARICRPQDAAQLSMYGPKKLYKCYRKLAASWLHPKKLQPGCILKLAPGCILPAAGCSQAPLAVRPRPF